MYVFPALALRGRRGADEPGGQATSRTNCATGCRCSSRRTSCWRPSGCGMRTTYDLEMMQRDGLLQRHRELLAAHRRPRPGHRPALPAGLLPGRLPAGHRRIPRDRAADRRDVRGRHVPQAQPGRARLPPALRDGQPAAEVGRVPGARSARRSILSATPGQVRAGQVRRRGRADHPAHRPGGPRGRSSSPPRARSTTCSARSASASSGTSASWSPR